MSKQTTLTKYFKREGDESVDSEEEQLSQTIKSKVTETGDWIRVQFLDRNRSQSISAFSINKDIAIDSDFRKAAGNTFENRGEIIFAPFQYNGRGIVFETADY